MGRVADTAEHDARAIQNARVSLGLSILAVLGSAAALVFALEARSRDCDCAEAVLAKSQMRPPALDGDSPAPATADAEGGSTDDGSTPGTDAKDPSAALHGPVPALTDAQRQTLAAVLADPDPEFLDGMSEKTYGRHYFASDEWHHELFEPHVRNAGGALVAVGASQGYLLMGWARPQYAWLIDYDPEVVALHDVYRVFFARAETVEQFIALWSPDAKEDAIELLEEAYDDDDARRRKQTKIFKKARYRVFRRLEKLREAHQKAKLSSYLVDAETYDYVRAMVTSGRARPLQVNLTAKGGLAGIGKAASTLGVPVRVLYTSNAESYWDYDEGAFPENVAALPFDERSVALRTISAHKRNGTYRYYVHGAKDYVEKLGEGAKNVYRISPRRKLDGDDDVQLALIALPKRDAAPSPESAPPPDPSPAAVPDDTPEAAAVPTSAFADAPDIAPCRPTGEDMACIPGGPFLRGSDDGPNHSKPQETVWVQTFYMDVNEVTYAEYKACEKAGDCDKARPLYSDFNDPEQPFNGGSWHDAKKFCEAHGKRLPTEAEWEKAARGTDGRLYPWGDEDATCEHAVIKDRRGRSCGIKKRFDKPDTGRPEKVGSKPPNQYGLYDMAGNSWEWVADWYTRSYDKCGDACRGVDPKGPCDGADRCPGHTKKIVRGGSWFWNKDYATTVYRRPHFPNNKPMHHFGFRCAATVPPSAVEP